MVFFFSSRRRHTRSKRDWSSDVCSSDLDLHVALAALAVRPLEVVVVVRPDLFALAGALAGLPVRSEERRVGKECRSRRAPCPQTKKRRCTRNGASTSSTGAVSVVASVVV